MLVLTRRTGQSIIIRARDGDEFVVKLLEGNARQTLELISHSHGKTRIGIQAPREVNIVRREIDRR
jgi:sRNA-binding carbon storage regulator CsrA